MKKVILMTICMVCGLSLTTVNAENREGVVGLGEMNGQFAWTLEEADGTVSYFTWYGIRDYKAQMKTMQRKAVSVEGTFEEVDGRIQIANVTKLELLADAPTEVVASETPEAKEGHIEGKVVGAQTDEGWCWFINSVDGKRHPISWGAYNRYKEVFSANKNKNVVIEGATFNTDVDSLEIFWLTSVKAAK